MSLQSKYSILELLFVEVMEHRKNEEYARAIIELSLILKDNPLDIPKLDVFITHFRDSFSHMPNAHFIIAGLVSLTMDFE